MKRFALGAGVVGFGFTALLVAKSQAADHLDAPGSSANPLADINDVYAWTTADATKVNLAMSISPGDDTTRHFGPSVQYVFHVTSKAGLGVTDPAGTETLVTCTFESDTSAQCWVGTKAYIKGDPSNAATGLTNTAGNIKMFAGQRSDPFFFNLQGFRNAVSTIVGANLPAAAFDAAGCPFAVDFATVKTIRDMLSADPETNVMAPCPPNEQDCFKNLNVKVILLQIDNTLLNATGNTVLGVWASTHTTPAA